MTKPTTKINPMKPIGKLVATGFAYEGKDGKLVVSNVWQKNS